MTSTDPRYGAEVRRRMATLHGAGRFQDVADVVTGRAGDRESGIDVQLQCRLVAGTVEEARFLAFGCPHVVAAASWLTDRLVGCRRADLEAWDWREAAEAVEVPPAKFGRLLTIQDAVRSLVGNWPVEQMSSV